MYFKVNIFDKDNNFITSRIFKNNEEATNNYIEKWENKGYFTLTEQEG